ncbi:XkdX family protein [Bacillus subtilis]|uniref:XkdX family protein n=1 Tax=Bacillus subtilis TaxID=1423 RepID=UPI0030D2DD26
MEDNTFVYKAIKLYYNKIVNGERLYSKEQVARFVELGTITREQYAAITGEVYPGHAPSEKPTEDPPVTEDPPTTDNPSTDDPKTEEPTEPDPDTTQPPATEEPPTEEPIEDPVTPVEGESGDTPSEEAAGQSEPTSGAEEVTQ